MTSAARLRAELCLEGLSVGVAFGETNFAYAPETIRRIEDRRITPRRPWRWTDDTAMALSIVDTHAAHGRIDADDLARRFAARHAAQPVRGYGAGPHRILDQTHDGMPREGPARG